MSNVATNNNKIAKTALNPNLSTGMEPATSSDSNQNGSKNSKKNKKRKKTAHSGPSAQPEKKTRNDYENLLKLPEAKQPAELNGYKIEGILKSVNSRDLRLMSNETLKELKYQLNEAPILQPAVHNVCNSKRTHLPSKKVLLPFQNNQGSYIKKL